MVSGAAMIVDKPKLLDLYCGGGGCTKGFQMAGFFVVGIDIEPQPRYCGDAFVQMDAIEAMDILNNGGCIVDTTGHEWYLSDFAAISASPQCQGYSVTQSIWGNEYPMQIEDVRKALQATGKPYVIENVPGAPLVNPLMLCGTMFGMPLVRHRLFECNPPLYFPPAPCAHTRKVVKVGWMPTENEFVAMAGHFAGVDRVRAAVDISWMNRDELAQAIPPAYTRYIGYHLMTMLRNKCTR